MKQGWEIKPFEEILEKVKYSKKIPKQQYKKRGTYPIVSQEQEIISGFWDEKNDLFRLNKPIVIFGDHTKVVKYIDFDFVIGADGVKILSPTEEILTKYLYYFVLSVNLRDLGYARHFRLLKEQKIPVPSLLEQGRIVGVLDAAFAKIDALKENAQKNLENAKALFQQVLKQELTPKPNWQTKKLGEIALKKLSYGASVPSRNFDGEYRYIRITDIDEDGKLLNDLVSPAVCEEKHILHSGDLLLARTGGTIGKSYLYSPEDGKCIYAGYLIRVIVNQDIVLPEFVFLNTKTDRYWNFIKTSQKTAAQPNINAQQYSSFDIPYPPKDEQEGIVRKIKSIFTKQKQLEKCCQKTIAECDALKQAVLRRAFNGEL